MSNSLYLLMHFTKHTQLMHASPDLIHSLQTQIKVQNETLTVVLQHVIDLTQKYHHVTNSLMQQIHLNRTLHQQLSHTNHQQQQGPVLPPAPLQRPTPPAPVVSPPPSQSWVFDLESQTFVQSEQEEDDDDEEENDNPDAFTQRQLYFQNK